VCVEKERKRETDRQTEEKGRKQRGRKEVKKRFIKEIGSRVYES
jgi:hypothetical protein